MQARGRGRGRGRGRMLRGETCVVVIVEKQQVLGN